MSRNEGGSQTGYAQLRLQRSTYTAESMNKDGLFHLPSTSNATVSEEGGEERGRWMRLPRLCMAAPAGCVSHSSSNPAKLGLLLASLVCIVYNGFMQLHIRAGH